MLTRERAPALLATYPLSAAQRRLWFIAQLNPTSCAYNNAHVIRFRGCLDAARLVEALHAVIHRHDSLRMRFVSADGPGSDVVAVVEPGLSIDVRTVSVPKGSSAEASAYEERFARDFAREAFDLAAGPLVRAALLRFESTEHVFVVVLHHIISDRWSFGILMRELAAFYGNPHADEAAVVPPLAVNYGDCSRAQANEAEATRADLDYWRGVLAGERPTLALPTDRARPPVSSERGQVVATTLTPQLVGRVLRVGAVRKATPYMTFLAAFVVLLQRSSSQSDVLVGTPVAGRTRLEREPLIGLFVNTLPVRVQASPEHSFSDVLANVRAAALGMLAHADVPFDQLVREELAGREGSRNPFFDVLFNFHNTPVAAAWPIELEVGCEDVDLGTARIDLALTLRPEAGGSLTVRCEFSRDLFERATIEAFVTHFSELLESIAATPEAPIASLAIATSTELETIVNAWSRPDPASGTMPPPGGMPATLDALIARTAALHPDAIALVEDGAQPLTYLELDRRANQLAHALRARGIAGEARVGIYLERSISAVVAMLAVLKTGAAYVPLDPAYPRERTAAMLANAGVTAVVARRGSSDQLASYALAVLDVDDPAHAGFDAALPPSSSDDPDRVAYVMFTSGSTGTPKAVAVEHRGVVALLTRTAALACTPADRFLLHAAVTFDASIFGWAALVYGARVAVMPARPFSLAEFEQQLTKHAITVIDLSAALFHQLVEERIDALRGLRRCTVGGDALSPAQSRRFVREVRGCRLFNAYGPTEGTVACAYYEVLPNAIERHAVPIGRPVADARIYILDDEQQPVPIGIPGELWVGGPGVARGYINDAALTAQRFVPDHFAGAPAARLYRTGDRARWLPGGDVLFLGRADAQVKIRGFRIEPAEIEFALLEHAAVRHAAVVARGAEGERYLIAYVELLAAGADEPALRAFLQKTLPAHAIPMRIIVLDEMPKTASGKLDRAALPVAVPGPQARAVRPAVTELQQLLAGMWEALLGAHLIGIDDDFFQLGGHSLLAIRLIGEIERACGIRLPLAVLFERPTIEHLADALQRDPANLNRSPMVALNSGGTARPLFFLHGSIAGGGYYCVRLAQRLGLDRPLFAMRPHGVDGRPIPATIEAIASECIDTLKSVRPHGPYVLGGFCIGGLVAFEMARQLVARGERVDHLILVDVPNAGPVLRKTLAAIGRLARFVGIPAAGRIAQRARISRFARNVRNATATHGTGELLLRYGRELRAVRDPARSFGRADAGSGAPTAAPDLLLAWRRLSEGYVARTYSGRVTVLVSAEYRRRPNVHVKDWPAVAPLATVRAIPGEHLSCITDHIATTATAIAEALAAGEAV